MLRALASSISGAVRLPTLASPLLRAAPLATIAPQKWREICALPICFSCLRVLFSHLHGAVRDWEPPAIPSTSLEAWVRDVHTGSDVGIVQLNRYIFGLPLRVDLLQRAVRWQLSRRFKGNHSAKDRAEVSGSTRKAMPQKHTGRARAGSIRAPQFRHGGVVFPPKPRSHAIDLPRKVRELSLRVALSVRYAGDDLVVATDDAQAHADHKTRSIVDIVRKNGWAQKSVLLVTAGDSVPNSLKLACQYDAFCVPLRLCI